MKFVDRFYTIWSPESNDLVEKIHFLFKIIHELYGKKGPFWKVLLAKE